MSVHYKFKSALEYDTVSFDGLHISVKDFKKAILLQKKMGKTSDFDLQVTDAQTKETYSDENVLIPKNASLIVARVPLSQQQRKQQEKEKLPPMPGETNEPNTLSQVDISSLDLSEEEKIKTMISQSTSDYDPSNYVKVKGSNQVGTVPASYICFKCHHHGHWIKDCPSTLDSSSMGMTDVIKKSTGIPRSFMIEVEGPQVLGARMTPSGAFAVPAIDHEVYKEKKVEKPPFQVDRGKSASAPTVPEDLICGICKDLLQDAVMVPCCGISFCDECIRNFLVDSEESECPDCNEKNVSPDTLIPNRFLRNSVNTFKNKTGYVKIIKPKIVEQCPPSPSKPSLPDFVPPPNLAIDNSNQSVATADMDFMTENDQETPKESVGMKNELKESPSKDMEKDCKERSCKFEKLKKAGIDIDDVSSVSSNASQEPPVKNSRPSEGQPAPSQDSSYSILSLLTGQPSVILSVPGSDPFPLSRPGDAFHGGSGGERSITPTIDKRLEVPSVRTPYDPYRPTWIPGYDPHYGMLHPMPVPYDLSMMYDRGYRGMPRGHRLHRGRYVMRQPPPPGSRPLTSPRNEEEAYLAFQRMLKEKDERDKRKMEKLNTRPTKSKSRSRSAARSPRSFSGARSGTPARGSRSRSKKKTRSRSRSFVMSRSRSKSYLRSPLQERNYSPKRCYSPHRLPLGYERYNNNYTQWSLDHLDYRRRGRTHGGFYKGSPTLGHDLQNYNRYRDENYMSTSPREYRSPSRYYDQRISARCDYSRDSREREYRSFDRETESRERNAGRSHSNSLLRNECENDREQNRPGEREGENDNRHRSRRSRPRRYSPNRKVSQERSEKKERTPEILKNWDREKNRRHRSRDRRNYEKDKRKNCKERDRSKDYKRENKQQGRSKSRDKIRHDNDRSRSKDKKKRSHSRDKQKSKEDKNKIQRSSSRHRSITKDEKYSRSPGNRLNKEKRVKKSESEEKDKYDEQGEELVVGAGRGKAKQQNRPRSKIIDIVDDKLEKKKDKEKKRKKKEKETDEERAARRKKKKEKKGERRKKQEFKASEFKVEKDGDGENEDLEPGHLDNSSFVANFEAVEPANEDSRTISRRQSREEELKDRKSQEKHSESSEATKKESAVEMSEEGCVKEHCKKLSEIPEHLDEADNSLEEDNVELEIHASYESLIEETEDNQKKGILASMPEISKWELDDNQAFDLNVKTSSSDGKSPDIPVKVTSEVIKRAENAIFKKTVNAIREPVKKSSDKEEKKDQKVVLVSDKEKRNHNRLEHEGDKLKRVVVSREKKNKPKSEVRRTVNSLQITIPLDNSNKRKFSVEDDVIKKTPSVIQRKNKNFSGSPLRVRVPVKERLGLKIERQGRNSNAHVKGIVDRRSRNTDEEESIKQCKKDYHRPTLASTIGFIDTKRSSLDEAYFVPNYDESSDEEDKNRPSNEEEVNSGESDAKKRARSVSESSGIHKKSPKNKKKKEKRLKKNESDLSGSSDFEKEKEHKMCKKKSELLSRNFVC